MLNDPRFTCVDGEALDTATACRLIVGCVATEANIDVMHRSAQAFPPHVSEAEALGIPLLPSRRVDSVRLQPVARPGGPYYYAGLGEIVHRPMLQKPPGG